MQTLTAKNFRFSDFELDGNRRLLLKDGKTVSLNPKAFDLLFVLVENRGEVLSKDELLERVWPGQFVEEGNLKVHISALRKALSENRRDHRFIVTVPGRGYSFVADVDCSTNSELVVEHHSFSRILINEEITEPAHSGLELALPARSLRSRSARRIFILAGIAILITAPIAFLLYRWNTTPTASASQLQIRRLTSNGRVSFAALSPDGKMFAYALKELEQNSLWLGLVEGGEDKLLRPSEKGRYNDLAFTADGNFVLFTFSGADSRESTLYKVPAFGGASEKLRSKVTSFGISPDGQRFAFGRYSGEKKLYEIVIARLEGGEDESVFELPGLRSLGSESLSWSHDVRSLAFGAMADDGTSHEQVFVLNVSDGSFRPVTTYGWKEVIKTTWIDGGKALLLLAQEKDSHTSVSYSQVWRVSLIKDDVVQITNDLSSYRSVLNAFDRSFLTVELRQMNNIWVAPYSDLKKASQVTFGTFGKYDGLWGLDWTKDGKIVFTSTDHQSQVISQMDADGSNVRPLTSPGYNDSMVNASADGRYIVFQSTRAGGSDIWRMDADGTDVVRLTDDGMSYQPVISPDSQSVYYKSDADGSAGMRRVSISGGQSEELTDKNIGYLSISPDGSHIAAGVGAKLMVFSNKGGEPEQQFDLTRFGTLSGNTAWSPDGKAIAYRDRGYGYWLQPIDGSEPQRMTGLPAEKFYNFAWSKDGKQFAFIRGQEIRDVVLFRLSP